MSFGGSVSSMITTIRNNRAKLGANKNKKQSTKSTRGGNVGDEKADAKSFTPEQMIEFRRKLKKQKRKENLPVFIIAIVAIGVIFYYLIAGLL